ncbi:MAG: acyl-CoA dehydrogenase family protein [Phenylobacterium sp.]|uniref:Acyl-CoA dehydrogenase family protein n=1 Tax=Phenylobacterium ferrooxidans TaxID=2982689 RepID=A0ABW6CQU1_9CAUL|nr:acyl-CoA dehydrogenase family protein [Phenylobacterium sp.]MDO8324939.1 acyl-CoA dehydrogenase family protein [Phenylobacterium sp.]MDO8914204.1 acyl-CoA dehydrogenase family protein [Phenylobacterium sp.]MDP3101527.1 acyl-CoA dehydrogenase family protein [Phenylobacterium sp.]
MADFGGADLDAFRAQAKTWLAENFPPSLKSRSDIAAAEAPVPVEGDYKLWKERMGAKGWGVPTWPSEYGGGGLNSAEARVLREEMAAVGAWNPIGGMGVMMFGPTLLEYGTEEQKQRHIPPIVRGELRWCQGYSEPGSGSDLASLQTKAQDMGDHFLVNGSKIWTSGAQYADWCFCLTRTDPSKKHEGISFLLIDMKTPGVEPRPILLISGSSPFCETFFTDVKVPKENLVGPLNGGWTVGKRLLQHERNGLSGGGGAPARSNPGALREIAKKYIGVDATGRLADRDFRTRLIEQDMNARAYQLTNARVALEARNQSGPSAATSIMKNASSSINVNHAEMVVEAMGYNGLAWAGDEFSAEELAAARAFLRVKSGTIAGGSYEIQNNIISKRILGLPDTNIHTY